MSSCAFEELVARVAAMLQQNAPQEDVDRVVGMLSPQYQAEVLASAADLLRQRGPKP